MGLNSLAVTTVVRHIVTIAEAPAPALSLKVAIGGCR